MSETDTIRQMLSADQLPPPTWTLNWQGVPLEGMGPKAAAQPDAAKVQWDGPDANRVQWDEAPKAESQAAPLTAEQYRNRAFAQSAMPFLGPIAPDVAFGASQVPSAIAQMATRALGVGAPTVEGANKSIQQGYQQAFGESPFSDVGRSLGQALVTAPALPMRAITGGLQLLKSAVQGGAQGGIANALTPVYDAGDNFWQQKGEQAKTGAEIGALAGPATNLIGRALSPNVSPQAKTLLDQGVTLTPGQMGGSFLKSAEEKATSIPVLGDLIKNAQRSGINEFNQALYRNALEPLGDKAVAAASKFPVGNEGIAKVGNYLSDAYDSALSRSVPTPLGGQYQQSMAQLQAMLPSSIRQDFADHIANAVGSRITPAGTLTPNGAKEAESALGNLIRAYKGSSDGNQRLLGQALRQAQANLRSAVAAANPVTGPEIQAINQGWANLTQLEDAGQRLGAKDGVIMPSGFLGAVRNSDNTIRNRAFARGEARNQDLAQAADSVLSNRYPDSGSIGRLLFNGAALGGLGLGTVMGPVNPLTIAGLGAAALPYLPGGRQITAGLLGQRPQAMQAVGDLVKSRLAALGGLLGLPALSSAAVPSQGGTQ